MDSEQLRTTVTLLSTLDEAQRAALLNRFAARSQQPIDALEDNLAMAISALEDALADGNDVAAAWDSSPAAATTTNEATMTTTIEQQITELIALENDCEPSEVLDAWVGAMNRASQELEDAASRYVEAYVCGRMEEDARRQALHGLLTHPDMRPDLLTEVRRGLEWL